MIRFFDLWKIVMILYCGCLMIARRKITVTRKQYEFSFALVHYVLLVLDFSIFPIPIDAKAIASFGIGNTGAVNNFIPFTTLRQILLAHNIHSFTYLAGNLIMMIPLAFFVPAVIKRSHCLWQVILAGALFSIIIEITRFAISRRIHFNFRSTDIDDVIINILGAVIGYGLYQIWRSFALSRIWNRSYFSRILISCLFVFSVLASVYCFELYTHNTPQKAMAYDDTNAQPIKSIPARAGVVLITATDPAGDQQTGYTAWYYAKDQFGLWMLKQKVVCNESVIMDLPDGEKLVWGFDMKNENQKIRFEYQNQIYSASVDDRGFWYQYF